MKKLNSKLPFIERWCSFIHGNWYHIDGWCWGLMLRRSTCQRLHLSGSPWLASPPLTLPLNSSKLHCSFLFTRSSFQMKKKYKKDELPHLILEVDGSYKGTGQTRSKGASLESMRYKVLQILTKSTFLNSDMFCSPVPSQLVKQKLWELWCKKW